jgi:hypothetical protein
MESFGDGLLSAVSSTLALMAEDAIGTLFAGEEPSTIKAVRKTYTRLSKSVFM